MGSRVVEKERESSASFQLVRVTGGYRSLGKLDFLITLSLSFVEPSLPPCQQALAGCWIRLVAYGSAWPLGSDGAECICSHQSLIGSKL